MLSDQQSLFDTMKMSFNEEEVQELCYYLNIDFDDLPAIGRAGKIRELILFCDRNGRYEELIDICKQLRPHREWPKSGSGNKEQTEGRERNKFAHEPEVVPIESGPFWMGIDSASFGEPYESPRHKVDLPAYWIAKYPITNQQYAIFVKETPQQIAKEMDWPFAKPPQSKLNHPVVGVSWHDALAYCRWLSTQTGQTYRLPTEAEWEKAARGKDGRLYPWGNEWEDNRCHHSGKGTAAVNVYPLGQSPFGCFDMVGNVWEWTNTLWGSHWQKTEYPYPYQAEDGREDQNMDSIQFRIFRGGSYAEEIKKLTCVTRSWYTPDHRHRTRGFRVVRVED